MAITILTPRTATKASTQPSPYDSDPDSEQGGVDLSLSASSSIVTPGEPITANPQWMRGHGTHITTTNTTHTASADTAGYPANPTIMTASVAGTLLRTNKLLSIRPLHARYTPEIGDLVVGRVVEVQSRRWRVDVGATQLATLQLSAINLPGGILRRRTDTDELQIRAFFAEGDVLVCEVQQLHGGDGSASLHARSLRYGKLRNGVLLTVKARGGTGGGVVRAKRHVWTMEAGSTLGVGAGVAVDVVLGVNGYVWVCKHVEGGVAGSSRDPTGEQQQRMAGINKMEENVSSAAYSSQNESIDPATMREITRVRSVIVALAENGLRVDENTVRRAYAEASEMGSEQGVEDIFFGGERGRLLVKALTAQG